MLQPNEFIDSLSSYMYFPYILHPTRATGHWKTIIDNILSTYVLKEAVHGNLTSTISNHLPQFYLSLLCSQTILLQNPIFFKEARKTSIKLNLSWITLINIGVTS